MSIEAARLKIVIDVEATDAEQRIMKVANTMNRVASSMAQVGRTLTLSLTAPIVAMGVGALKASIEFEQAFSGVRKTVAGTTEELDKFAAQLRDMAKQVPFTTTELSHIAEVAGQLGIPLDNLQEFTKVIADFSVAVHTLTPETATLEMAQFMEVMQSAPEDIDRVASVIVDLGNKMATTEDRILNIAKRMSAAASTIGASESEVLGLAAAIAATGVQVEAAGTAMSNILSDIGEVAIAGGENLTIMANTAGQTSEAFQQLAKDSPIVALQEFLKGLKDIHEQGGNVFAIMDALHWSGFRTQRAVLALTSAMGNMNYALDTANQEWTEADALTVESSKRYDTMASKLQVLRNKFHDAAITLGDTLKGALAEVLPSLTALVQIITNVVSAWTDAPPVIKILTGSMLVLTATMGPLLWVTSQLIHMQANLTIVQTNLGLSAMTAAGRITTLGASMGTLTGRVAAGSLAMTRYLGIMGLVVTALWGLYEAGQAAGDAIDRANAKVAERADNMNVNTARAIGEQSLFGMYVNPAKKLRDAIGDGLLTKEYNDNLMKEYVDDLAAGAKDKLGELVKVFKEKGAEAAESMARQLLSKNVSMDIALDAFNEKNVHITAIMKRIREEASKPVATNKAAGGGVGLPDWLKQLGNESEKSKPKISEAQKQLSSLIDTLGDMRRELTLMGDSSEESAMRYDTSVGKFSLVNRDVAKSAVSLAAEVDRMRRVFSEASGGDPWGLIRAAKATKDAVDALDKQSTEMFENRMAEYDAVSSKLGDMLSSAGKEFEFFFKDGTRLEKFIYDMQHGLFDVDKADPLTLTAYINMLDKLDKMDVEKNTKEAIEALMGKASGGDPLGLIRGANMALDKFKELDDKARARVADIKNDFFRRRLEASGASERDIFKLSIESDDALRGRLDLLKELMEFYDKKAPEIKFLEKVRDIATRTADTVIDALMRIQKEGFGSFFKNILAGFQSLMFQIAMEFLQSQLVRALMSGLGGLGGTAGAVVQGLSEAPGRAHGGPVYAGGTFQVGERGPEIFRPSVHGDIVPAMAGAGGPIVVNVNIQGVQDVNSFRQSETQIAETVHRAMQKAMRRS